MTREFGARIKALRTRIGLSQADLAGPELSHSYISLIEAGKRLPSGRALALIAERLGCDPDGLRRVAADNLHQSLELALAEAEWSGIEHTDTSAAQAFDTIEEQAGAAGLPDIAVRASWGAGRLLERRHRYEEATDAYDRTLRGLGRGSAGEPARLEVIAALCRCAAELGEFGRVAELGRPALEEFQRYGGAASRETVDIICAMVWAYLQRGETNHARRLAVSAVSNAERLRHPGELARAYRAAGQAAQETGRTADALMLVRKALAVARGTGDELCHAHLLALHGSALLRTPDRDVDEAERELRRALAVLEAHDRQRDAARCWRELARCALARGEGEAAVAAAVRARTLPEDTPPAERAGALILHAAAQVLSGRTASALADCDQAVELLAAAGREPRSTALTWAEVAEVYHELGEAQRAAGAWRRGFTLLGSLGPLNLTSVSTTNGG